MSFLDKVISLFPGTKKEEEKEYFFALNIGQKKLEAALWMLSGKNLEILQSAKEEYSQEDEIIKTVDRLLDNVLGSKDLEPQKILFGVPNFWLLEDDLKEEYLKLLRNLVKELELEPLAYVATSDALLHSLENKEGVPPTAIMVGFEKDYLSVTVSRAGKSDGTKVVKRSDNPGLDIEKALLQFTSVETLPSKILIYGESQDKLEKLKSELLTFSWMSKLSFLHFPKIDILEQDLEMKSICFAGAKEIKPDTVYIVSGEVSKVVAKKIPEETRQAPDENLGFVVGDVSQVQKEEELREVEEALGSQREKDQTVESEDFEKPKFSLLKTLKRLRPKVSFMYVWIGVALFVLLITGLLFLPKAHVKIFVEPVILERDTEVTADPKVKEVLEDTKVIPGQIVETEISGSGKGEATGRKEIGDPAKGTIVIYNKTFDSKTLSKGTTLVSPNGFKFTLDTSVNIASQSATDTGITFGKANATVTASAVGADGNLPSGTNLTVSNFPTSLISAKAEGNFSGGTSKQATVVSEADQNRLLAQVAAQLRSKAQQKLQESLKDKKILEEALSEEIIKKSFSKNVNDQASQFSLDLTVKFRGTAFEDKDLKAVVSKLVTSDMPEGFELNFEETETQADVSKLEKDGKLVFLARFRAKLLPKLDLTEVKNQIKGKTPNQAASLMKQQQHILGSEIKIFPKLPPFLQLIPFLERNIEIEVGLK